MNHIKTLNTLTLLLLAGLTYGQTNCTLMHSGSFYYQTEPETTVQVTANTITEQYSTGAVVSAISWQTECSYTATIQSVNVPDFPYAVGDAMQVTINEVTGNEVHYTSTIDGESWEGVLVKE